MRHIVLFDAAGTVFKREDKSEREWKKELTKLVLKKNNNNKIDVFIINKLLYIVHVQFKIENEEIMTNLQSITGVLLIIPAHCSTNTRMYFKM